MKATIYKCDRCGSMILENPWKLGPVMVQRETEEPIDSGRYADQVDKDLCESCMDEIIAFSCLKMKSAMKLVLAPPEPETMEDQTPEPEPEPKPEPKQKAAEQVQKKVDIDEGKLFALLKAGWDAAMIAVEFHTQVDVIQPYIDKFRKIQRIKKEAK